MFRPASRTLLRHASSSSRPLLLPLLHRQAAATHRALSTSAAPRRSTLKGAAARWALAAATVYWYTTSSVFADEPKFHEEPPAGPTEAETDRPPSLLPATPLRRLSPSPDSPSDSSSSSDTAEPQEEDASQEGAFNPETGEINWDCPCLGGMAHGPCGPEFRAAFSCFVFSAEEPKGVDCIDRFKAMQACFQKYPEVYGSELDGGDDDDDDDEEELRVEDGAALAARTAGEAAEAAEGAAAKTGQVPARRGVAPAARGGEVDAEAEAEATTAPGLAEPSRAVAGTAVLQAAHRGDARARSIGDPPTAREAEVAAEDAPRERGE